MRVLVLNSGSSSLKFRLFEVAGNEADDHLETIRPTISGAVQGIGDVAVLQYAEAVGCRFAIKLIPHSQPSRQKREAQTDGRQAALSGVSSTSQLHKTFPAEQGNRADG